MNFLEKRQNLVATAMRFAIGWHLAYLVGHSAAMGVVDVCLAWGLLVAGVLLILGRLVRPAALFGILYLALMYILNPPHFGHTGESHFLYIDRNVVEICMLVCVMAWKKNVVKDEVSNDED